MRNREDKILALIDEQLLSTPPGVPELISDFTELKQIIDDQREERAKLRQENASLRRDLEHYVQKVKDLERAKLRQENASLRRNLEHYVQKVKDLERAKLRQENASLRRNLEPYVQKVKDLETELCDQGLPDTEDF